VTNAAAQDRPAGGLVAAVGLGYVSAGISVGGQSANASGLTGHGRLGFVTGRRTVLVLDAELQPFDVTNPARAEAFRSTYVLLALQRYLSRHIYGRVGVGVQLRKWSGADPVTSSDGGLAFGAAFGAELPLRAALALTPELVLNRAFIEAEGAVTASLVGVRLGMAWRR
jgi:hypothetical protein